MYGYIYITINNINNKKYIGMHKSAFIDKRYIGSGKIIKQAIKLYGRNNFECKILDTAETRKELCEKEKFWIKKENAVEDPMFYNIASGGDGGDIITNFSEERKLEYRNKMRQSCLGKNKGRTHSDSVKRRLSECAKKRIGDKNPFFGKNHSEKTKSILSSKTRERLLGNKLSDETKNKIRERVSKKVKAKFPNGEVIYFSSIQECVKYMIDNYKIKEYITRRIIKGKMSHEILLNIIN